MKKSIVITALVIVCAVWIIGLGWAIKSATGFFRSGGRPGEVEVTVPKGPAPERTLAVFHFRPSGEPDAKLYAVGFARALADRLYCAPTCITQQSTMVNTSDALRARGLDPLKSPSDASALNAGRKLGVRSVMTGDLMLSGTSVRIAVRLADTSGREPAKTLKVSGKVTDLPALQTELATLVARELDLRLSSEQENVLARPNFTNPATLKLYGRSVLCKDIKQCGSLRWQAAQLDPASSFATIRLLEYCYYGPATGHDIQTDSRLATLRMGLPSRFPGDSSIALLDALLLSKEYEYQRAQQKLETLVRQDSDMLRAHYVLAYVALDRGDSRLAMDECEGLVDDWPTNAYYHALLASAHSAVASDARKGKYYSSMTPSQRRGWQRSSRECLSEALTAVTLDPDCADGWGTLLEVSRELGEDKHRDGAFEAMVRIDPKNMWAYQEYAFCFVPQWGGSATDREQVFARAEKAFGRDSAEVCLLRARNMMCWSEGQGDSAAILALIEKGVAECKGSNPDIMITKSRALRRMRRYDEALAVARDGLNRRGALSWRWEVAESCAHLFDRRHDRAYLNEAAIHYAKYAQEMPFDSDAQVQWGWCLSHLGDREQAKQKFLRALELDPGNEVAKEKMKYVE